MYVCGSLVFFILNRPFEADIPCMKGLFLPTLRLIRSSFFVVAEKSIFLNSDYIYFLKLTANAPENRPGPKRKLIFQPSIVRCELLVLGRVVNCTV